MAETRIAAVRRFQAVFLTALDAKGSPTDAAVGAAVAIYDFARDAPEDARQLAALPPDDLFVGDALAALSRRLFGNAGPTALQRTTFAAVDISHGAVRRHLLAGSPPPRPLRSWIETAVRSALKD